MSDIQRIRLKFIGVTGGKGTGKDTVSAHLEEVFHFRRMSFAEPIKRGLAAMFNVPYAVFETPAIKETPMPELLGRTPRHLMQTLGTEWGRVHVSPSVWLDLLMLKATAARADHSHVVVSDVRFDNEAQAIRAAGGEIWRIERGQTIYSADTHASEAGVSDGLIDHVIRNTADLRMLYTQVGVRIANIDKQLARSEFRQAQ